MKRSRLIFVLAGTLMCGATALAAGAFSTAQAGVPQRLDAIEAVLGMQPAVAKSKTLDSVNTQLTQLPVSVVQNTCSWHPQNVWITPKNNASAGINQCPGGKVVVAFQSGSHGTDQEIRYLCCSLQTK